MRIVSALLRGSAERLRGQLLRTAAEQGSWMPQSRFPLGRHSEWHGNRGLTEDRLEQPAATKPKARAQVARGDCRRLC